MLRGPRQQDRTKRTVLLAATVVGLAFLVALPSGGFASGSGNTSTGVGGSVTEAAIGAALAFHPPVVDNSTYDWPELHRTPNLNGYEPNNPLTSLNASKLGVAWATNLYGSALDSPAVAFDGALGQTLAYIGTETGNVLAINIATGQIDWGVWLGSPIRSSPLVSNGSVFVGTFSTPAIYRLNATTGAVYCSLVTPRPLEATPTLATPPNGVPTLFIGTLDSGPGPGPFIAMNAGNCSIEWEFSGYHQSAGSWDSASYAVSASGVPMVLFGTDNPDSSIYALNALTGQEIWRFQAYNPPGKDFDVAAGVAISAPGKFGFAQGAAFVTNKAGRAYALYLNNGTLIWKTDFDAKAGISPGSGEISGLARSTPALDGPNVIFGFAEGLFDLNATTGAVTWVYKDPTKTESIASPAIAGNSGHGIVVTGDVGGDLDVVSVVGGTQLYSYQTGGYITGSPAIVGGNILLASTDGYLYDFALGGGDEKVLPTTMVTSPVQGTTLANPHGNLTVRGTSSDKKAVVAVMVAVQLDGTGGPWWDAATQAWSPGPMDNPAALRNPGGKTSSWSLAFPVPPAGGTLQVTAYAVSSTGQSDVTGSTVSFSVLYSTSGPHLEASSSYAAPGGTVTLSGGGFGHSQKVTVTLFGQTLAKVTSSAGGALPATTVTVPTDSPFGLTSITAADAKSGESSSAGLTIANSWEQSGYGPGHTGYEPNDPTLNNLIFPGGNQWLKVAWHFDAGVPINASPAVVDGVAYVANTAGQLFAVNTHNGGLVWTFTLASGAAIDGAPAVDPALGLVFVGANDGTIDAVFLFNGTLDWSTSVGGDISAPVYGGGTVYAASSSGTVEALAESTGSASWSIALASPVSSAPALNISAGLLVVGESNGAVVGLSASTGAALWTFKTGGAVVASATLSGGTVYIGSEDQNVYALDQSTGAELWSFNTGAAVEDTGSLLHATTGSGTQDYCVGSSNGDLYVLRASDGAAVLDYSMGSPIVGVSTVDGAILFETASGVVSAARSTFDLDGWNFATGAGLTTSPVVLDGAVYVGAEDGSLYAFTSNGQAPA